MDLTAPRTYRRKFKCSSEVARFIDACKFGQTEYGSFIINLVCPLQDYIETKKDYVQLTLFDGLDAASQCFTRKVVNKTLSSVASVKETIDSGHDLSDLSDPLSPRFVSVNFLESLQGLSGPKEARSSLDISAQWAPLVKENRNSDSIVKLSDNYSDVIRSEVERVKNQTDEHERTLVGVIVTLHSTGTLAGRTFGQVKMSYLVAGTDRTSVVTFDLPTENYSDAVEAHKLGRSVQVVGVMDRPGHMINAELEVLEG